MDDCVLTDDVVWLSRPIAADIDAIVECCRQPSIVRWTVVPQEYDRGDAEGFLRTVVTPGWAARSPTWGVRTSPDGPIVGMIGLAADTQPGAAEIGFWLGTQARGRGLMTAAVRLACDFGFAPDGLALTRIEWRAYAGNRASAAVARRAGFHYEGLLRRAGPQRGVRHDCWIAGRLASDPATPTTGWPASTGAPVPQ